jgi:hypothetical protein
MHTHMYIVHVCIHTYIHACIHIYIYIVYVIGRGCLPGWLGVRGLNTRDSLKHQV